MTNKYAGRVGIYATHIVLISRANMIDILRGFLAVLEEQEGDNVIVLEMTADPYVTARAWTPDEFAEMMQVNPNRDIIRIKDDLPRPQYKPH